MGEKVKTYWEKVREVLGKVSKKAWIAIGVVLVVIAAAIAFVVASNNEYDVLFTDLNTGDVTSIVSYLEGQGITDYRLENGDTILVRKGQVPYLQMSIVMEGYGTSGFAYEYYTENAGMLSTQSERDRAWLISVTEKLRATIITLDGVKDAQVILTEGEDNSYVLDSNNKVEATASVKVTMQSGRMLTDKQAAAIRALVATGVQGLEVDSVVVVDQLGNLYSAGDELSEEISDSSTLKLELEEKYNNLTRTNIMQVLVPLFGVENVKVGVNCTVDVNHMTQASTDINLPDWATNGEGIIGSKIYDNYIVRNEGDENGGVVGTDSNAELPNYVEEDMALNGTETELGASGQIDYDNPRTETYTERTAGYLTDCMVSVSINSAFASTLDMEALKLHVARAAGIPDEYATSKISVFIAPFYVAPVEPPAEDNWPLPVDKWVVYAAAGGLLLFLLLVMIISSSIKKKRSKKRERDLIAAMEREKQQALEQLMNSIPEPEELAADVMSIKNERSMELRKDIRKFADESPEIAAQIVKNLLKGGDGNG